MKCPTLNHKTKEWVKRYVPAEILGTLGALITATFTYSRTHSYAAAAAAGWVGEGVGFYGYFITAELLFHAHKYQEHPPLKRIAMIVAAASRNLVVEFAPAEILDNFFIRPLTMYIVPQYLHPYPLGFVVGKLGADMIFYVIAVVGYETRKRWLP